MSKSIYNAMTEIFEEITIFDKPALFTCMRIDRGTVPQGYYQYEVRHDDVEGWGVAVQIAKNIKANHFGTVIINEKINLHPGGYLKLNREDVYYYKCDNFLSMKEYIEKYPPKTKPPRAHER